MKITKWLHAFLLCLACSGCASTIGTREINTNLTISQSSSPWESTIVLPGTLQLEFIPVEDFNFHLTFLANKRYYQHQSLKITLSDADCDSGFMVKLQHYTKSSIISDYFDTEFPLHTPFLLSITLDDEGNFSVRVKDETISGKTFPESNKVKLSLSHPQDLQIHNIRYTHRKE